MHVLIGPGDCERKGGFSTNFAYFLACVHSHV